MVPTGVVSFKLTSHSPKLMVPVSVLHLVTMSRLMWAVSMALMWAPVLWESSTQLLSGVPILVLLSVSLRESMVTCPPLSTVGSARTWRTNRSLFVTSVMRPTGSPPVAKNLPSVVARLVLPATMLPTR